MKTKVFIGLICIAFSMSGLAQTPKPISLDCFTKNPDARIFTEPSLEFVDLDISSGLGSSWGFEVTSEIVTSERTFYSGILINPRGNPIDGIFYILKSEWSCAVPVLENQKVVEAPEKKIAQLKPPKAYTVIAYKMYTCDNKHLDLNNLDYQKYPSKTRNYSILVNGTNITITDLKLDAKFRYEALEYNKVKGYDHYVDPARSDLSEFYIDRAKKILISRAIIDNGFRDTYSVYLLK